SASPDILVRPENCEPVMNQHAHEPSETPAGLQRFVAAARAQPLVETNVTAEAGAAGLEAHRRRAQARRTLLLSARVAMAASVIAAALLWPLLSARSTDESRGQPAIAAAEETEPEQTANDDAGHALASAVRLRSTAPVEVLGPWSIALHEGTHEIEVD